MAKTDSYICLYSGLQQRLMVVEGRERSGWVLAGGFDPALPFTSREAGELAFRRRRGKDEAVKTPACPYTGVTVEFVEHGGLWYPSGDFFRPYGLWVYKEKLEYAASFRRGRTKMKEPHTPKIQYVGDVREPVSDPAAGIGDGTESREAVEELFNE